MEVNGNAVLCVLIAAVAYLVGKLTPLLASIGAKPPKDKASQDALRELSDRITNLEIKTSMR